MFPGVQKSTWDYDEAAKAYYFHRFYDFQPDLNTSNPEVQAEILKIMGFWLQLGVSGFRMDAVPFVISQKGANIAKPAEQYDMLRAFSQFLTWREGEAIILAEANVFRNRHEILRHCRRTVADDVQFRGESASFLRSRQQRFSAACKSNASDQVAAQLRRSGDSFFGTMTNSILAVLKTSRERSSLRRLVPIRRCSCISVAFGADSHPCCREIAAGWNLPIA